MAHQLTFDLPVRTSRDRGDFFIADSNAVALAAIERWKDWPSAKLVLTGPDGSGKSHLVEVWATLTGAEIVPAGTLATLDTAALAGRSVAVEDADRVAGQPEAEAALFHLHNLVLAEGGSLLLTSRAAPTSFPIRVSARLAVSREAVSTPRSAPISRSSRRSMSSPFPGPRGMSPVLP